MTTTDNTTEPTLADLAIAGWQPGRSGVDIQPRPLADILASHYAFVVTPIDPGDPDDPSRWEITFPDLPGLSAYAVNLDDLGREASDAVAEYVTSIWEDGYAVPIPTGWQPDYLGDDVNMYDIAEARQLAVGQPAHKPGNRVDGQPDPELTRPRFTAADVAGRLDVARSRVHQIARELGVGTMVGNARLFSVADLETMRRRSTSVGRPRRADGSEVAPPPETVTVTNPMSGKHDDSEPAGRRTG